MKLVSYRQADAGIATGVLVGERVVCIDAVIAALPIPAERAGKLAARGTSAAAGGMLRLLQAGPQAVRQVAEYVDGVVRDGALERSPALAGLQLLAPVPRPGKIVAVGRNYADHAKETGVDPFEKPRIIAKLPSSVTGPGAAVRRPGPVRKMDFEAELAVVIGDFAAEVPRARALDFVAGYMLLNDLSAREFQFDISPPQTTFAKSMDGFCPMGPYLTTRDEIADPQALDLACHVNGERMQHGHTADMIFPVDRLIEYLSDFMTLEPGDVIATGTPAGIGAFRKPPVWLQPGDRIRIEISGLGVLENTIA
jgi:2-keto-4-pentenoate hydratase/2-oxohepta-3-ene-1,7-dioic acid hydratase in catechol pathway